MTQRHLIPWFTTVIAFRSLWAIVATLAINALLPLGTPWGIVAVAGILGIVSASKLAHSRLTTIGMATCLAALWGAKELLMWLAERAASVLGFASFSFHTTSLHIGTALIAFSVWAVATWIFWRARLALAFELLCALGIAISLFSGHRDFHLDKPRILNSIAWRLGVDHLTMLILIGSALVIAGVSYLYFAFLATRPRADVRRVQTSSSGKQVITTLMLLVLVGGIIYLAQRVVYGHFNQIMLARVANGVGMNSNPGVSPLSFQSALGSTNQPAGIVRLEGDYSNNPFSPMMYLRESALSSFNGKEMVFAGRAYDSDLPVTSAVESFSRKEDGELGQRTPLVQSIFLLADHDHAFAVDYPVSIVQLKNPRPNRFKATYRAYSVAPAYAISELSGADVGDPRWTPDVRQHYLAAHPDKRYTDLAAEITKDAATPIDKVFAITNYLSRTAIYTLTPNHDVKPEEDQVAPFLFGDHRGYCVHFAHAIVYMARSLGIPARVGTGYLTDLSQAKDGHILLRMSDRHAWAEVFVSGIGWIPFDVQPDQVESHAETQVDAKLLEELMGILEPGEEILPSDAARDEPGMTEPEPLWIPSPMAVGIAVATLCMALVLIKVALRHGWRVAPTANLKLRWGYISVASFLYDLGIRRDYGETRLEFARRIPEADLHTLSSLVVRSAYTKEPRIESATVENAIRLSNSRCAAFPRWRRVVAACNPASILKSFSGGDW